MRRVEVVVNPASTRTDPGAAEAARTILAEAGVCARLARAEGADLENALAEAVSRRPDLLIVIAGDGTARAAAALCGPDGPLLAPLAGGALNMLPKALYGPLDWQTSLRRIIVEGQIREMAGGEVAERPFYVAAILGAPALWAEAREAARLARPALALQRARDALRRAFSGRLRYASLGQPPERAWAICVICPMISNVLPDEAQALEVAAMDPAGAIEAFRLAARAAIGDWRSDPAVTSWPRREALVWAAGRIPAILDGEPTRLGRTARIQFRPRAFRALALDA